MKITEVFFISILLFSQAVYSQQISGKIISSAEADSIFGVIQKTTKIRTSELAGFAGASEYLYFTFRSGSAVITNQKKEVLYPEGYQLKGDEKFTVYSSFLISELGGKAESDYIEIQMRNDVLTISNGNFTLEFGMLCPPYCY